MNRYRFTARVVAILALGVAQARAAEPSGQERDAIERPAGQAIRPGPSITLAEALAQADKRNPSLEATRTDIAKARADLKHAWALLLPTAFGSLTFTHNDHADTASFGGQTVEIRRQQDLKGNLRVSLPLINAPAWLGVSAADIAAELSELSVEQVRQGLLLTVAQAYYSALSAQSLIDVQREQIRATERHLQIASVRHRSGTGSRLDVLRARTERVRAREDLLKAQTALENARDALAALIKADRPPMPSATEPIDPPLRDVEQLVGQALKQREDIRAGRTRIRLADRQLDASWMRFVPSLSADWQLNQQITDPSQFSDEDKSRWFILLTLTVPLYDHTRYAELDRTRAALHRSQLELENATLQAAKEVRQTHRNWLQAQALVNVAAERAKLARESLALAEAAYENGTGSSLDVTDARRTDRQAEIDLATKRFDAQLALLTLLRRVGTDMATLAQADAP